MTLGKKPFENIVGKGENAGDQHFLHFPQCFSTISKTKIKYFNFVVFKCSQFGPVKILSFSKPRPWGLLKTLWEKAKMQVTNILQECFFNPFMTEVIS